MNTVEDLARVKSVVVEAVSRRGVSVLNADDPHTIRMARHAGGRVCWFSLRGGEQTPGFVLKHVADGGMAVLHDASNDEIVLFDRGRQEVVCRSAEIPATMGGHALFNVQNALAAIAMSVGAGVSPSAAGAALASFQSTFAQNPGRMNVHDAHGFRVILDYAHNPEALKALGLLIGKTKPQGARSICMISIPGDRRDDDIRQMGEIGAEHFDVLVFRETPDNRGRPRGEVVRLLSEGALAAGYDEARIHAVPEEEKAAEAALKMAEPGDLVILTPTRVETVWDIIQNFRPHRGPRPEGGEPLLEPAHG